MDKCPMCQEYAVERDSHYTQDQLVCTSCGCVVNDKSFAEEANRSGTTLVNSNARVHVNFNVNEMPKTLQNANYIYISKGKLVSLNKIKDLASFLHFSADTTEEINNLFLQMVDKEQFKYCRLPKKIALVGCCAYIILRQNNWPITIPYICNLLQCSCSEFTPMFKVVLELTGIQISTPKIEELVPATLKYVILGDEREKIIKLVIDILQVAQDCWLTYGRKPQPLIFASTFVAWKSLSHQRINFNFFSFCENNNILYHRSSNERLKEINSVLIKLAEKLPWIEKGDIKLKHIPYMLESILKYYLLVKTDINQCNNEETSDMKDFYNSRIIKKRPNSKMNNEDPKQYSEEFDDSELDKYIRTEKEVKAFQQLIKKIKR